MNSNLPPGVLLSDIDGPPMPKCAGCGCDFNPFDDEELCEECLPEDDDE